MVSGEQVASKSELSSKRNIEFRYTTERNMAVGISVECMLLNENSVEIQIPWKHGYHIDLYVYIMGTDFVFGLKGVLLIQRNSLPEGITDSVRNVDHQTFSYVY
jgi:hypothetical protein